MISFGYHECSQASSLLSIWKKEDLQAIDMFSSHTNFCLLGGLKIVYGIG
jgi:hypothetical protein